jgi:hypothetical protein
MGWVLARIAWFPVDAAVLGGLVALTRRFEGPWKGVPPVAVAAAAVLAAGFGAYAVLAS